MKLSNRTVGATKLLEDGFAPHRLVASSVSDIHPYLVELVVADINPERLNAGRRRSVSVNEFSLDRLPVVQDEVLVGRRRKPQTTFQFTKGGELSEQSQRDREARTAGDIPGVDDIHFLGYEDTHIPYDGKIIKRINDHLNGVDADLVYIHTEEDTHQDHRRAALASVAASRNIDEVLAFESPSTRSSFDLQYYNALTEYVLEQKIEAIRAHESQSEKKYLEAETME